MTGNCASEFAVAPYAGAWIEIQKKQLKSDLADVAPYAGAWIEMYILVQPLIAFCVAPYAGAWIEIKAVGLPDGKKYGRSLRGSVD